MRRLRSLTLSQRPDPIVPMLNEVGVAETVRATTESARLKTDMWLWDQSIPCHRVLTSFPNVWSLSSSCLSWHGILLSIQLTVPSMLVLLDGYIQVDKLVCAHLMRRLAVGWTRSTDEARGVAGSRSQLYHCGVLSGPVFALSLRLRLFYSVCGWRINATSIFVMMLFQHIILHVFNG